MRNILIVAGGVVAVAAIAAGIYFGVQPSRGPAPVAAATTSAEKQAVLSVQPGDHVKGDPNAPITLIEYASLDCPHCAHFNTTILPELEKKWIDNGKVKLIYRDFPLDQVAVKAAQLARCAGKDRYFAVVDMIFRNQATWSAASDPVAELSKSMRIAGLSENDIKACLADDKVADQVIADYKGGETLGVNSTPTLFINGELYRGARSVDEFNEIFGKLAK
jgi:protein-disulfide isomerase